MIFNKKVIKKYVPPKIRIFASFLLAILKIWEERKIKPADVLLICSDENRGYVYLGQKYAQILDSINERLSEVGLNCLTVAFPHSSVVGNTAFGNVIAINGFIMREKIKSCLKHMMNRNESPKNSPLVMAWRQVLKKVQPKIIIGIQPYPEVCYVAKQKRIWVADIQHGVLSDEGYYGQTYRGEFKQMGWPDCILCWDEGSANWVREKIGNLVESKVIGNPWFLRFLEPRENDKLVASAKKMDYIHNKPLTILVTLQWGMERFGEYHETGIPLALIHFIKEQGMDYIWWIRIHPIMMQESNRQNLFMNLDQEFKQFNNIFWEACSEEALPIILGQTDLHITTSSAVTIEASWFNIKTALLSNDKRLMFEYFGEQINKSFADIVHADQESIRQWIEKNKANVKHNKTQNKASSESLDRFIDEIKELVTRS